LDVAITDHWKPLHPPTPDFWGERFNFKETLIPKETTLVALSQRGQHTPRK
jgi:hypothetical protein